MVEKPKIRFIANPFSGTNKAKKLETYVDRYLDKKKYEYDVRYTDYAGHAVSLAQEAVDEGYFGIIAVGGDGTLNEIASVMRTTNTALGVIPMGSGNGFSYHIGVKRDVQKAFNRINNGRTKAIDLGYANERLFINVAGLGLDAAVASITKTNKRRGLIPYITNTIRYGLTYPGIKLKVETTEGLKYEGTYSIAAVANGSIYGYNFSIAPAAKLGDGLFDVVLVAQKPAYKYFGIALRMLTKTLNKSDIVTYIKCKGLIMSFEGDTHLHVDGESGDTNSKVDFRIEQKALLFIR
jgi:diacylglycerol kinase (ATP)